MNFKINILLLNWNSSIDIKIALDNIISSNNDNFRVILIDNFSEKQDRENLTKIYEEYKKTIEMYLVLNDKNYGYAGGNNKGYDYLVENNLDGNILILNPDVKISKNTISKLQNTLNDNVGGVMSRTLNSDGSLMYDYIKLKGFFQKWLTTNKETIETDYIAGSCMLLKREIINKIGLFDESFFMYWEEVDLSLKIKELGYKLISTTNTNVIRKENSSRSNQNAVYFYIRNSFYLKKSHPTYFSRLQLLLFLLFSFANQLKLSLKEKKSTRVKKFIKGFLEGIKC